MPTDVVDAARSDQGSQLDWPTRVLIVDDAGSTRLFLRGVLESCPQFDVAGEADNGATAIEMADALQPDLVLLDLSMPVADGQSALASLLRVAPHARVVVLSGTDPKNADELVAAGATAFLPKGIPPFELLDRLGSIVGRPITVQRTPPASPRGPETSKPIPQSEVHAILCDDDAVSRKLVAHVLAGCDVSVTAETDAVPSLLSVIGLTKPDLVVLDLWLEGTTGLTAISEIRTLSPRTLVVVYSAYEEWREKAVLAGVAAFVAKPHFDELEREIRRLTRAAPR